MSENLVARYVPPGAVCIQCSVGSEVANDSIFGSDIDASTGRVVDGVLGTPPSAKEIHCTWVVVH